ncbi:MAG: hypothetical protein FJ115_00060 [Deltaproteobacteria bacterium]|nr:hypothetical protein [Deltaproteobacteria bacterium]MBM4321922.1 hypothetical protein [Deltaproteobacteria bacterium]
MDKERISISRVAEVRKLTKKLLMELEEGCYLRSSTEYFVKDQEGQFQATPRFGEYVLPLSKREEQWKRILRVRANNRLCDIYRKLAK